MSVSMAATLRLSFAHMSHICAWRARPGRPGYGILGTVTDLGLALITGGFTIGGVVVTFGGSYLRDKARDRRADRQARDSALADLLTTSVELVLAVNAI